MNMPKKNMTGTHFRRLFEAAQDGILLLHAKTGKITDVNRFLFNLLGYTREEVLGKRLWELGFLKDVVASKTAFKVLQRTGYVRYDNIPLMAKDGRNTEVEFVSNVYQVGDKQVIQCNVRDASERKRIEHLKDNFINTASHEIRNPISILKLGIESLETCRVAGDRSCEDKIIKILKQNAEKLVKLVSGLLDLSRFESDKMGPTTQTVNISALIQKAIRESQDTAKERGLVLYSECEKELPPLHADPILLMRVLTNLLDNALRFAKTKIVVKARKVDSNLQISVINDGPGIKPEDIPTLFDKFVQINRPLDGNGYKGTGLGLAICSEISKLHKGKIWVESEKNHDTQFHFDIPM